MSPIATLAATLLLAAPSDPEWPQLGGPARDFITDALGGRSWTAPALAGIRLFLRNRVEIVAFELGSESRVPVTIGEGR